MGSLYGYTSTLGETGLDEPETPPNASLQLCTWPVPRIRVVPRIKGTHAAEWGGQKLDEERCLGSNWPGV